MMAMVLLLRPRSEATLYWLVITTPHKIFPRFSARYFTSPFFSMRVSVKIYLFSCQGNALLINDNSSCTPAVKWLKDFLSYHASMLTTAKSLWGHGFFSFNSSALDKMTVVSHIFRSFFINEKFCVLITILLKCVTKDLIDNNSELVEIIDWRRIGDDPVLTHICGTRGGGGGGGGGE